jgi:hypothetical protein
MSRCQEQQNEIIAVSKAGKAKSLSGIGRIVTFLEAALAASEGKTREVTVPHKGSTSVALRHAKGGAFRLSRVILGLSFKLNMLNARG